ncbi:hypothetical protein ACIREE_39480 [Streptomyces sp. NPDC102467]|uniref:hypothetical protein n=1 Tax=Streptomyces sp. NPDC102467 TaxID=3366179 RepID=UPI00381A5BE0
MSEVAADAVVPGDAGAESVLTRPGLVVAVAVIAIWLTLLAWLAFHADAGDVTWSRLLVVLGSVEAVAFAAVGVLFGSTVQRQRVEDLRVRADAAESRADAHQTAAVNGQRLAEAVRASHAAGAVSGSGTDPERLSAVPRPGSDHLVDLADRLFPR